nr:MAG TPA_asm: tail assembly chaperone protein [Caudoviricetes sp.]
MRQAKFEVKNRKIGANTFYVRAFPPLQGLKLYGDLQKAITAALKGGLTSNGETEDMKEALLGAQINVGAILAQLGESFNGEVLTQFSERLLDAEYVSVKIKGEEEAIMLTEDVINELFTGKLVELLKLEKFIIEVNFGDFFALIPNLSGVREMLVSK